MSWWAWLAVGGVLGGLATGGPAVTRQPRDALREAAFSALSALNHVEGYLDGLEIGGRLSAETATEDELRDILKRRLKRDVVEEAITLLHEALFAGEEPA